MPKTKEQICAEFDRAMNAPSPNPRYGGVTPVDAIRRMVKSKPKIKPPRAIMEPQACS